MALALITASMWRPKNYHGEKEGDREIKRSIRQTDRQQYFIIKTTERRPVIEKVYRCGQFSLVRRV